MRKKRKTHLTPLARFLAELKRNGYTFRQLANIAQTSPSVLHGWANGAYPSENAENLKRLCNYFGVTLAKALTGSQDVISLENRTSLRANGHILPTSSANFGAESEEQP